MDSYGRSAKKTQAASGERVSDEELIGMGYTSEELTGVSVDGLWEALVYKSRKPQEFMDVTDVRAEDRRGFLSRSMKVKANGKTVHEHIYCSERKGEMVYRVVDDKTKRESQDERVISIRKDPLRLEFFHRHASDGYRSYWAAPKAVVSGLVAGIVELAKKLESNNEDTVGLGVHSAEVEDVSYDAMWKAMIQCIREPARFMQVRLDKIEDADGCVRRTVTMNGKTVTDNVYVDEGAKEIVYRLLDKNGSESETERVVALRAHPMQVEFHCRNARDGFRMDWAVPKRNALSVVDSYVREAKRLDKHTPEIIGYGVTSDPITGASLDSLIIAVDRTIQDPGLVMNIDESATVIREERGYIKRSFKLTDKGVTVTEKVTINEEAGEFTYNKYLADGREGPNERVLAIRQDPLRIEMYERKASDGTRFSWTAPYKIAQKTMSNLVALAKKIEGTENEVIGYGLSSKPMKGIPADNLWKAMLNCVRNPGKCGMNVSNVQVFDNVGYMTRFMTIRDKKNKPQVIDNVYVNEQAREIRYRVLELERGGESLDERVFAIRTEPLRCEMWCRHTKDQMRTHWTAPKAVAQEVFNKVEEMGRMLTTDRMGYQKKFVGSSERKSANV